MQFTSNWELSRRSDCQPTPLFCPPVREGASEFPEHHRLSRTVLDATHVREVRIGVNQEALYAGRGSTSARNDPQLSCRCCAEEALGPLSQALLRDADLLLSIAPDILGGEPYNKNRAELEIGFIRNRVEESEITCGWGSCGDHLKIKEIKTHLVHNHDIKSNPKPYGCSWNGCSLGRRMTELSSLVRHVQECHCPEYKWPCPSCWGRFTRAETLLKHFEKCSGRRGPQAAPHGQRFA